MSTLRSLIRLAPKRFSAVVAMVAAAIIVPAVVLAWGPERPTFTMENAANYVTFNSITNNPSIGDERNFVGIRENGSVNVWYDDVNVQPGKEYIVRMYVHNNAATNLNLVAENVTAKFNLPTSTGKSLQVNGFVSASNATPREVYDHATFTSDKNFNLDYIEGSLKYENNAFGAAGTALPESIFTSTGALLGYDKLDGKIPGCMEYSGYVSFKVQPQFAPSINDFTVKKEVRKDGDRTFVESVASKPGDKLDYRIVYTNTGNTTATDVVLKDTLPKGVSFVPGTVKILNAANPGTALIKDGDKLFSNGVNIGNYTAGSNAIVVFDAIVDKTIALEKCGINTLRNVASAQPAGQQPKEDSADTTLTKECQPQECKPGIPVGDKRCEETPVTPVTPTTPTELPKTGTTENIVAVLGLSTLIASIAYYVASRRALV